MEKLNQARLRRGFTLVEMLVAMTVTIVLMLILANITSATSTTWRYTTGKIEQFRDARTAFERMTNRLSQATLNTYWDYDNPSTPTRYVRRSELRYVSGNAVDSNPAHSLLGNQTSAQRVTQAVFFHAPLGFVDTGRVGNSITFAGMANLLNEWGYYVEYRDDSNSRPGFLSSLNPPPPLRYRYRLMEYMQSSDNLPTYYYTSGIKSTLPQATTYGGLDWYLPSVNSPTTSSHILAENVIALIVLPRLTKQDLLESNNVNLAPNYFYDTSPTATQVAGGGSFVNTRNQLPPTIQVTMIAIDEGSAVKLRLNAGSQNSDLFGMANKFQNSATLATDLSNPSSYTDDSPGHQTSAMGLEQALIYLKANYRIFTTNVPIRGAKWSRSQNN